MATKTQIANLALARIGVSQQFVDVDAETSVTALTVHAIYDLERLKVLRDFAWPFARKYALLTLLAGTEAAPVNPDWIWSYLYPADCVFARRIVGCEGRYDPSPPPFAIGRDDTGPLPVRRVIYTNQQDAALEYTVDVEDAEEFEPTFVSMLAWRLAAQLAVALGRLPALAETATAKYDAELAVCVSRSVAEGEYAVPSGETSPRVREIFNLALTRLGVSRSTAAVDAELSLAMLWPRLHFGDERDFVLRDFPWPFATVYAIPPLVSGTASVPVNGDWAFAYLYPADALAIRRIVTPAGRRELAPPEFRVGMGVTNPGAPEPVRGRLIYTNWEISAAAGTSIEYTGRITDPAEFDPAFMSMLAWRLAANLAPAVAGKDPSAVARAQQGYEIEKSRAQRMALNEAHTGPEPDAEWIRCR